MFDVLGVVVSSLNFLLLLSVFPASLGVVGVEGEPKEGDGTDGVDGKLFGRAEGVGGNRKCEDTGELNTWGIVCRVC